jgi:signal transduction histidine kinase
VLPVPSSIQHRLAGLLVLGLSAHLQLDNLYRDFCALATAQVATAVANARAYEAERQRAEALAELDRAKTAFFSNVSHEFRTPLTLALGPMEDLLAGARGALLPAQRADLEVAHRNALRLLRLVNTLLDFSRIEAGRVQASYEATDLAALTADLASTFRSAVERAGLSLVVDCAPLPAAVETYVDRDMWEKIVLNLVSNAFKFTLAGEIVVSLRPTAAGDAVALVVRDSGIGIPAAELPRLFERFHRVAGARARTQEGTGIGLALVQELVALHGGTVEAQSALDVGTTFTVTVPTGSAHLPPDRIGARRELASTAVGAAPYVEEALRWLPDASAMDEMTTPTDDWALAAREFMGMAPATDLGSAARARARVLLADDNADMREYVSRLLGQLYEVEAVPDGRAALAAAQARPPDLVVSDVMMPGLDGFALLRAVRADPRTRELPVILLSARAGEEARVDGLHAGADDYLVKPFAARELLARVGTHLTLARLRAEATRREQAARAEAETAVRARDQFLSIAAHELRTPLAAVKGLAQLALRAQARGTLDAARTERALRDINHETDRLAALIDDLLDVSRLQGGQLSIRPEPVEFLALLREVVERQAAQLRDEHTLRTELPAGPVTIDADAGRLEQIVDNLLSNAVKYSPDGGPIVVRLEYDAAGLKLAVQDSGIGLPAGAAAQIFEPFGRAANATDQNLPGMGLGLYISRRIAELHGGRLWAESPGEGQGTTLRLWLPRVQPREPDRDHA